MVYQRLGRARESSLALASAEALIAAEANLVETNGGDPGNEWLDWVMCQTVFKQAAAACRGTNLPTNPFAP